MSCPRWPAPFTLQLVVVIAAAVSTTSELRFVTAFQGGGTAGHRGIAQIVLPPPPLPSFSDATTTRVPIIEGRDTPAQSDRPTRMRSRTSARVATVRRRACSASLGRRRGGGKRRSRRMDERGRRYPPRRAGHTCRIIVRQLE